MSSITMEKRLSNRNKWCYTIGSLRDCLWQLVSAFLLVYIQYAIELTDQQFAAIGIIMIIAKIWDAVNDPLFGMILENSHFKSGKFRPWILWGAAATAVITACLFNFRFFSGWGFVAFFGVGYILFDMAFTMNDVGYWSMLPALTTNPKDRTMVTTLMSIFCSLSAFAVQALIPVVTTTNKVKNYSISSIVIVSIFFIVQLITYLGVKEDPRLTVRDEDKISLKKMWGFLIHNDQLLWITLVLCFYYLGSGLLISFGTNFCNFEFGYEQGGSVYMVFAVVYLVATLASQAAFPAMVKALKRQKLIGVGTIISVIGYAILMMFGYVLPKSIVVIVICGLLIFFGQNIMYLAILVQMTNTVEYNELLTGERIESIVSAVRSFLAKLTGALQTGIITFVLLSSGIKARTDGIAALENQLSEGIIDSAQTIAGAESIISATPSSATLILRIWMVAVPIVLMILTYIVGKAKYNISEERYDEIIKELDERKNIEKVVE